MTRSHNIVGSEATGAHRLVAFCHAHGSIVLGPRRRLSPSLLIPFAVIGGLAVITITACALRAGLGALRP